VLDEGQWAEMVAEEVPLSAAAAMETSDRLKVV